MRYYEPAGVQAVLDRILAEPSLANGVSHHAHVPARAADLSPCRSGWTRVFGLVWRAAA